MSWSDETTGHIITNARRNRAFKDVSDLDLKDRLRSAKEGGLTKVTGMLEHELKARGHGRETSDQS